MRVPARRRSVYGPMHDRATPEERRKLGQARRKQMGRHEHGVFNPKARQTPPLALLDRSMRARVPPLVKLKYEWMGQSPLADFRGAVPGARVSIPLSPNELWVAHFSILRRGKYFPQVSRRDGRDPGPGQSHE